MVFGATYSKHLHGSHNPTLTKEWLKKTFMKFDINGDNVLSKKELVEAFQYLGAIFPSFRAWLGMRHADANGDGSIDEEELASLVDYAHQLGYKIRD